MRSADIWLFRSLCSIQETVACIFTSVYIEPDRYNSLPWTYIFHSVSDWVSCHQAFVTWRMSWGAAVRQWLSLCRCDRIFPLFLAKCHRCGCYEISCYCRLMYFGVDYLLLFQVCDSQPPCHKQGQIKAYWDWKSSSSIGSSITLLERVNHLCDGILVSIWSWIAGNPADDTRINRQYRPSSKKYHSRKSSDLVQEQWNLNRHTCFRFRNWTTLRVHQNTSLILHISLPP